MNKIMQQKLWKAFLLSILLLFNFLSQLKVENYGTAVINN